FNKWDSPLIFSLSTLWLGVLIFVGLNMYRKTTGLAVLSKTSLLLYPFLISAFINVLYTLNIGTGFFYILLISPMVVILTNKFFTAKNESKFNAYIGIGFAKYLGISGIMTLMFLICLIFLMTPLFYIIRMVLELNIDLSDDMFQQVMTTFSFFTVLAFSSVIIIFIVVQSAFLTFTFKEIQDANGLKESITQIGKSRKAYGIETE
ncbi:MAG: hypothetical protein IT245_01455, partial [Bacteroidia bacterium]|nr:hypothetical protein [Bacteroidia bacterium]